MSMFLRTSAGYHATDSDADDEYERSLMSPRDLPKSPTGSTTTDILSNAPTPTDFGPVVDGPRFPRMLITDWGVEECKEFLTSLGLLQYHGTFRGKRRLHDYSVHIVY